MLEIGGGLGKKALLNLGRGENSAAGDILGTSLDVSGGLDLVLRMVGSYTHILRLGFRYFLLLKAPKSGRS